MSDDRHSSTLDGLGRWLADDADTSRMPNEDPVGGTGSWWARRWVRAAGLIAPWLVAGGVLLSDDLAAPPPRAAATTRPAAAGDELPARTPGPSPSPGGVIPTTAPSVPSAPADQAAAPPPAVAATAVRLVRDAVTGDHGNRVTALDVAAAEPPIGIGTDTWLVRVHAVLLRGDRTRWRSAAHEVWAVPVGRDADTVVGLEQPWRVARDAPRVRQADWRPATADLTAVRSALRRAGYRAAGSTVERHPTIAGLLRVEVTSDVGRRHVWLRDGPPIRVLGRSAETPA